MKTFRIERKYEKKGTMGKVYDVHTFICYTIERAKDDPEYPCIEEGWYIAKRYNSPLNKRIVWLLQDVPGKSMIELHIANYPTHTDVNPELDGKPELKGCIAPGKDIAPLNKFGEPGVSKSGIAFEEFMALTADEETIAFHIVEAKNA